MFNEIFVQHLQAKGLTAYKVAKDTGIPQGQMNKWKNGKGTPTAENLIKIADYLDCTIDFLLGRTKEELNEPEDEHRLIKAYRQLTDEGKRAVLNFAEMSANSPQYQKYTDIPKEA